MVPPYTHSGRWAPRHQLEQKRETRRAMYRTFSCSVGCNLCSFKSLLPNPNLNVSPPALERHTLNPNQIHCTHALLLFNSLPLLLPVYYISSVHIPKVCVDVWPVVCSFPATWINKEQPTRQSIHREAGSINISYVQLRQTVRAVDCINRPHGFRTRRLKCSPHVTHLPIDHINVWTLSLSASNWCVYCFFISVKQMRKRMPWASKVVLAICYQHTFKPVKMQVSSMWL